MPHTPEQKRLHRQKPEVQAHDRAYNKAYYAANRNEILEKQRTPEGLAAGRIRGRRHYHKHRVTLLDRSKEQRDQQRPLKIIKDTAKRKKALALQQDQFEFRLNGGPITWAYLAGLIDGEGCVGTTRTGRSRATIGRLTIANTYHELLHMLGKQFGGTVNIREKGAKPGWRPFGSITWSNRQALYILTQVVPYLIIKRAQANLCLELIRMRDAPKSDRYVYGTTNGKASRRLKPAIVEHETAIATAIKQLNRKGVTSSDLPSEPPTTPPQQPAFDP